MEGAWKRLGKEEGRGELEGRRNNEGFRASVAHGSGCTSVRAASGQQLLTAQRVGAESLSQHREPACRSGGARLASANCFFFFFPFPLSLRLCADSHVGELIKPHVLLHRSWGPRMMTSRERHSPTYGRYGSEALGLAISRGFPRDLRRFLHE